MFFPFFPAIPSYEVPRPRTRKERMGSAPQTQRWNPVKLDGAHLSIMLYPCKSSLKNQFNLYLGMIYKVISRRFGNDFWSKQGSMIGLNEYTFWNVKPGHSGWDDRSLHGCHGLIIVRHGLSGSRVCSLRVAYRHGAGLYREATSLLRFPSVKIQVTICGKLLY